MPLALSVATLALLHGVVTVGPTTPVCRQGTPCTRPAAHVRLVFTQRGLARRTTTDGNGRYSIRLPAGTWIVRASTGMSISPARITVGRAGSSRRDFRVDTGIR